MFKILHIHSDSKFLTYDTAFEDLSFSNSIIFISDKKQDIHSMYPNYNIIEIENNREGLYSAINLANNVDLVVVYMMDISKSFICNRIRHDIPIIWRFFGAELYGKLSKLVYSEFTKKVFAERGYSFSDRMKCFANNLLSYGIRYRTEFERSMVRANAIAMLYKQEYEFLSTYFDLPKFIQLAYGNRWQMNRLSNKSNTIILGNSRNRYNNHLDIINLIKKSTYENYIFELPFNYGEKSQYSNAVLQEMLQLPNCHIIKDFMPVNEYSQLFSNAAAFVFNAYRQMAMGNIFIAIQNNTKVYLNPRNSAYKWFLDEGFEVFSIEKLVDDMNNGNIYLSAEASNKNSIALNRLSQKYNDDLFVKEIHKLINNK